MNQTKHPKISVIIPSFNQGRFLEQTIQSVLKQNYPNLELMILDGGSSDQSVNIIRKYEPHLAFWRSSKDEGHYAAIQEGFARSSGEIQTWINSDDLLAENSLQTAARVFLAFPNVEWITGCKSIVKTTFNSSSNQVHECIWKADYIPLFSPFQTVHYLFWNPFIQQEGTFWRRVLWERSGGLTDIHSKLAGDLELWLRFFCNTSIYSVNTHLGIFRSIEGQVSQERFGDYMEESNNLIPLYRSKILQQNHTKQYNQILLGDSIIHSHRFLESNSYVHIIQRKLEEQNRNDLWTTCHSALNSVDLPEDLSLNTLQLTTGVEL